ncbi:MAG TPA: protein-L-isoaspartate(D-aspartate) O-methyltransferase [Thermoanaerobaculia bacterium]|nr:protein-L-isoaspartate(D-aspartate) O-methyltransferase [Thermoanaerobaculia bacterium]
MADADLAERRRAHDRERMVREHVEARGVRDPRVLQALREVPRHRFVREHLERKAYGDFALPIEGGQTISQPFVVARMTELLAVEAHHRVLEIGTGSGYQAAVLARLARWVWSLERLPELARLAIARLRALGVENVKVQVFDGSLGWAEAAPFDRILVTAAAPGTPETLLGQLGEGGRLVVPEGSREAQRLVVYRRVGERVDREQGEEVAFVPLVGRHGWRGPAR